MSNDDNASATPRGKRIVTLNRQETGFGFNLRGQTEEGGQLKSLDGELYAPLQFVSCVDPGGAAEKSGLKVGDRIVEANGMDIQGSTHRQAVDIMKSSGDRLILTIISVTAEDAVRLDPDDRAIGNEDFDYTDIHPYPITIPNYAVVSGPCERYTAYNIHLSGRKMGSRRYKEFEDLDSKLRKKFKHFKFPKLPGKCLFQLSPHELETRRRGLEDYLMTVCSICVIAESDEIDEFFKGADDASPTSDIQVLLPDRKIFTITVEKTNAAQAVWEALATHAKFTAYTEQYFYLFEMVEPKFERKLQPDEIPYNLFIDAFSTACVTCLCVQRWLFTVSRELTLPVGDQAVVFLFHLTVNEVRRNKIRTENRHSELEALNDPSKAAQYLALARTFPRYGDVQFPQCPCINRKGKKVIPVVGIESFRIYSCEDDGSLLEQMVALDWDYITCYNSVPETNSFEFQYNPRHCREFIVTFYSPYHRFLMA